jgi:DNA polymerase III alpha subunit
MPGRGAGEHAVPRPRRLSAHEPPRRQQAHAGETVAAGALDELEPDRARACAAVDAMMSLSQQRRKRRPAASPTCSAAWPRRACAFSPCEPWPAAVRLQKEYEGSASSCRASAHDNDELLKRCASRPLAEVLPCAAKNAPPWPGRPRRGSIGYERRTKTSKMGIVMALRSDRAFSRLPCSPRPRPVPRTC